MNNGLIKKQFLEVPLIGFMVSYATRLQFNLPHSIVYFSGVRQNTQAW
jgi:hypothetical protein